MKHRLWNTICVTVVGTALWAGASNALVTTYVENFTTTQYKDPLNTTAWWDTTSGELKLHRFAPSIAGSCDTPGIAYGVAVSGDYAFMADEFFGIQVIDISDPTAPLLAGSCDTPGSAMDIAISGDYAYVADRTLGLQVIDIRDPDAPSLAGSYDTPDHAWGVAIWGDHAYVADHGSGLQVIDIIDPANPSLEGSYDTPGDARGVAVSGDYAYVADGFSGLQVIDISDPAAPSYAGSYDPSTDEYALNVVISGDFAYMACGDYDLRVIDISDPTNPSLAGNDVELDKSCYDVAVSGDRVYLGSRGSGLLVVDISDPTAPFLADSCDTPGDAWGVAVSGDYAYVADDSTGLQVIDIRDPAVTEGYHIYTPPNAQSVAIAGDYAYVANGTAGLQVIDISDPTAPSLAGSYDTPEHAFGIAISGDYAFVGDYGPGLQVIDISDPTAPSLAGGCDTPGNAWEVAVSGNYAFVADRDSGFQVIDISDPTAPSLAGGCDTPGNAWGVAVSGNYAYVADSGFQVIDISDPTAPSLAGGCDTPAGAVSVAISGDYAYVADGSSGLQVIDISDPTTPSLAGSYDTPDYARSVAISGDYAYVADGSSGLLVVDISDPTAPFLIGNYDPDIASIAADVAVSGDYAYVADVNRGLHVIRVFQSEVDMENNEARSLAVDTSDDTILRARVTTAQTGIVTWELSANGGASWQSFEPDGTWNELAGPGDDLMWRSTHAWTTSGVNPGVSQLQIDWLVEAELDCAFPEIVSCEPSLVTLDNCSDGCTVSVFVDTQDDYSAVQKILLERSLPGLWVKEDSILASISTPPWTLTCVFNEHFTDGEHLFRVVFYCEDGSQGFSEPVIVTADRGVPVLITGFEPEYSNEGVILRWTIGGAVDLQGFNLYRSSEQETGYERINEGLVPVDGRNEYVDRGVISGQTYWYRLGAVADDGEWMSQTVSITVPAGSLVLHQNCPNPFNPMTSISFVLPTRTMTTLVVYDVGGRYITTLVDDVLDAGLKEYEWQGRDADGKPVSTGVYFYRLTAGNRTLTKKMVLLK